eukprot:5830157-Prymnesium_polylepis.1
MRRPSALTALASCGSPASCSAEAREELRQVSRAPCRRSAARTRIARRALREGTSQEGRRPRPISLP